MTPKAKGQQHQAIWDDGYNSGIDEAIALIRENLGDRLVNGAWQPGTPECAFLIAELLKMRAA